MKHSFTFTLALALLLAGPATAQRSKNSQREEVDPQLKPLNEPPRSDSARGPNESSSKDRTVDISPPPNDAKDHPEADIEPADGITEMKPWDPHQADKDIEVGIYYFKEGNYKAAESRFRGALHWQDNNAEAKFRLAQTLDKTGRAYEARRYYEAYLKILPTGEFAKDAKKALGRLAKTEAANKASAATSRP